MLLKKAEGYAGSIITGFLVLFFVIVLWNVFTPVINNVLDTINSTGSISGTFVEGTFNLLRTAWQYFPLILTIGVIIFIIVRGIIREPYAY